MADFNWNDHPVVDAQPKAAVPVPAVAPQAAAFDWNHHPVVDSDPEISPVESFVRSAAQMPTLGWSDELVGAEKAGMDALSGGASSLSDLKNLYTQYRDMERRKDEAAKKANPKSSIAGTIGGGLATAMIPGMGISSVPDAIALGAAGGLGSSEADLTKGEIGRAAADTAVGGAIGGVVQSAIPVIGKGISGLRQSLQEGGEKSIAKGAEKVFGSLKPTNDEMGAFRTAVGGTAEFNPAVTDEAKAASKAALDEVSLPNIVDKYVNVAGGPAKTEALVKARINEIEAAKAPLFKFATSKLNSLQTDQIQKLGSANLVGKLDQIADEVAMGENNLGLEEKRALAEKIKGMFNNYLKPVTDLGGKTLPNGSITPAQFAETNPNSLMDLDQIKKSIGEDLSNKGFQQIQKMGQGSMSDEGKALLVARDKAYSVLRDQITDVGNVIGGNLGDAIKRLNLEESNLIKLSQIANKAANNEAKSSFGGVASGIFGSAGAALGGSVAGPVGAGVGFGAGLGAKSVLEGALGQDVGKAATVLSGKIKQNIGQKMVNVAGKLEAVEPALNKVGGFIEKQGDSAMVAGQSQKSPFRDQKDTSNLATYDNDQLGGVAGMLNNSGDEKLAGYGQNLNKALQSGDNQAKNAAIFLIMQNPKARQHLGLMKK